MSDRARALLDRVGAAMARPVPAEVAAFATQLAHDTGALAVLFYGSNLRSGALDGVLDFYVLTEGRRERGLWPRVSYHERDSAKQTLRAKAASMNLKTFAHAASGAHVDTTVWARFVQPVAMVWVRDEVVRKDVVDAVADAVATASRFAAALGPATGMERDYWQALFRATYRAELRVEKGGREEQILTFGGAHFDGLLPAGWAADGIAFDQGEGHTLTPHLSERARHRLLATWARRRRWGRPLNVARLLRAGATFDGGARYLAWKVERHSGVKVNLTPFRERHPLLCAPVLVADYWRAKRRMRVDQP